MFIFPAKKPATDTVVPEPKLTPEELAIFKEQERLEKLAEKLKEKEELKRKWEEEKERRKKEKAVVNDIDFSYIQLTKKQNKTVCKISLAYILIEIKN